MTETFVEYGQYYSSPPPSMKVATVEIDGKHYQAVCIAGSDGSLASSTSPIPVSLPGEQFADTLGSLNDEIDISTAGKSGTVVFEVSGTWKGKIVVEGAVDGTYNNLSVVQPGGAIAFTGVNNDNQNGVYRALIISAYTHLRLRMSEYTSGTATVVISTAQNVPTPFVWQLVPENLNMLAHGATGDATYKPPRVDSATHTLQTMEHTHHEVHEGCFFRSGMNFTLSNGQVATLGFTTPNTTVWAHMYWFLETSADGTFTVLEDVTSFSGGAAVTPLNHNRNSTNTSDMTLIRGMTDADLITPTGGTTILNAVLSTGKGNSISAGHGEEFILKQNSNYLFRYTNGTSANVIRFVMEWYEHQSLTA